jgi:hypothetical protein
MYPVIKSQKTRPRVKESPRMVGDIELFTAGVEVDDVTAENDGIGADSIAMDAVAAWGFEVEVVLC